MTLQGSYRPTRRQGGFSAGAADDGEPTDAVIERIETCHAADGMLRSSPMYQGTISGALKNALDWLRLLDNREPPFLHDEELRSRL